MKKWVHIFARVRFVYENHPASFWHFIRWLLLIFARVRFKCRFPSVRKMVGRLPAVPIFLILIHRQRPLQPSIEQDCFVTHIWLRYAFLSLTLTHHTARIDSFTSPGQSLQSCSHMP